jgi:hypothetical protein
MMRNDLGLWVIAILSCAGCDSPAPPKPAPPAAPSQLTTAPEPELEPDTPFDLEDGFRLLTLADFEPFPPPDVESNTWTATADGLECTGKPRGYLYSKESFQNFTWRLEYRFPRPAELSDETKFAGNTGFLVYITGEHKIWPLCLEVQGKHAEMGMIKENGGAQKPDVVDEDSARQSARKPVGQWNALEIVSRDGALIVTLNGQQVASSQPVFLSAGSIGIQAENFAFAVRRMRIGPPPDR